VVGDLLAWCLLLLGVVVGLGTLGAVGLLVSLGGRLDRRQDAPEGSQVVGRDTAVPGVPARHGLEQGDLGAGPGRHAGGIVQDLGPGELEGRRQDAELAGAGPGRDLHHSRPARIGPHQTCRRRGARGSCSGRASAAISGGPYRAAR
jgi:hypothetical protein